MAWTDQYLQFRPPILMLRPVSPKRCDGRNSRRQRQLAGESNTPQRIFVIVTMLPEQLSGSLDGKEYLFRDLVT